MRTIESVLRWLAVAAVAVLAAVPAFASNWGSQGTTGAYLPNNGVFLRLSSSMRVIKCGLLPAHAAAVDSSVYNDYDWTDLGAWTENSPPCECGDGVSERICVFDYNYGDNGYLGWNTCAAGWSGSHPNMKCRRDDVTFNDFYTPNSYTALACHELGHAVGLRHNSSTLSCMFATDPTHNWLSSHDINHLNTKY